jgi:hypothetical protein
VTELGFDVKGVSQNGRRQQRQTESKTEIQAVSQIHLSWFDFECQPSKIVTKRLIHNFFEIADKLRCRLLRLYAFKQSSVMLLPKCVSISAYMSHWAVAGLILSFPKDQKIA